MARIRSIKPDFFTSETIARLALFDRLLFIGLWTHVDDNGVCIDNPALVRAALFPLDDEVTTRCVDDGLMSLSRESLVTRYVVDGKRYLHISSWSEHQKVQHPGKPRYPLPDQAQEIRTPPSCDSHETLTPEQGAGSREQGKEPSPDRCAEPEPDAPGSPVVEDDGFDEFWARYPRRNGVRVGKAAAHRAWKRIAAGKRPDVMRALDVYAKGCGEYPKDAERWLRPGVWDEWLTVASDAPRPADPERPTRIRNGVREVFSPGAGWCAEARPRELADFEL